MCATYRFRLALGFYTNWEIFMPDSIGKTLHSHGVFMVQGSLHHYKHYTPTGFGEARSTGELIELHPDQPLIKN